MDSLIRFLETYNPKPQYAQIANGGNWEEAVHIDFGNGMDYDISSLGEVDTSIAGEVFYKLDDGRAIFFGVRYSSFLKAATPKDFLKLFAEVLKMTTVGSIKGLLTELGQLLNNDPSTFTAPVINHVELGVEGYWKSVGSKVLRKSGESGITKETIQQLVGDNVSLLENSKNNTALEFAVSNPECWFGVQVSKESNGQYVTDLESVVSLSNMI